MTEAERKEAHQEVDAALHRAEEIRTRGDKIAQGWIKSRRDNNFRLMLRQLGQRTFQNGT